MSHGYRGLRRFHPGWLLVPLAAAVLVFAWFAGHEAAPAAASGSEAGTVPAQRVAVDPETGDLVPAHPPTGLQIALEPLLSKSTDGLVEIRQADGSVGVALEGRFQSHTVASVNDDGSVRVACVTSDNEAHAASCPHHASSTER